MQYPPPQYLPVPIFPIAELFWLSVAFCVASLGYYLLSLARKNWRNK